MPLDQEEIDLGRGMGSKFFKASAISPGQSVTVVVVDITKQHGVKYPIKGKDYCYRLHLEDGQVWDINSQSSIGPVMRATHPDGKTFKSSKITIFRKPSNKVGESPYEVSEAK